MDQLYWQSIVGTMKSVTRPGSFATGGECYMPLPGLSIHGLSDPAVLGLPLCGSQATAVKDACTLAPYGKGTETVVDTAVRKTWQLNPDRFTIRNSKWATSLSDLVEKIKEELGCQSSTLVRCELYKLLLYETGGLFKPHRDSEKEDGMFGTLVVQLPSIYDGGQLIVKHLTERKEFDFSGSDNSSYFHYVAFYADCIHEVKPVTQGYRLCLVYNLMYKGLGVCPAPVDHQQQVKEIVSAMNDWNNDKSNNCPLMMAYVLEHQYPKSSTSFRLLKRADKAMADVLIEASKRKGCFDLSLTAFNACQVWSADDSYCGSELLEEEVTFNDGLEMPGGYHIKCADLLYCDRKYYVPEDFLEGADPDDEEYEPYTGNAGATLSKQYSRAVLLIWPPRNRCKLLTRLGLDFPHNNQEEAPLAEVVKGLASCRKLSLSAVHFLLALLHNEGNQELFELALTNSFSRMAQWSIPVDSCLSFLMFLRDTACIKSDLLERTVRNIVASLSKSPTEDATDSMALLQFVSNLHKPDIVSMILEAFTSRANSSIDYYHSFLKLIHDAGNMEIFELVADKAIDTLLNMHNRPDYAYIGARMPLPILSFFKQIGRGDLLESVTQNVAALQRSRVPYDVGEFREFLAFLSGLNKPELVLQAIKALFEGLSKPLRTGVRSKHNIY